MAFSHAAVLYPSLPHAVSLAVSTPESCTGPLSNNSMNSMTRSRRPTRPSSGALFLHPSGSLPAGVSSSLFTLKPRATPKTYPVQPSPSDGGSGGGGGGEVAAALDVRLVEETDLAEISALLAEVRGQKTYFKHFLMPCYRLEGFAVSCCAFCSTPPKEQINVQWCSPTSSWCCTANRVSRDSWVEH